MTTTNATARTAADRSKAMRLRFKVKAGAPVSPEDAAWLHDYEQAGQDRTHAAPRPVGASGSRKTVHVEEEAFAVGTGSAAEVAAAGALAREEGRRLDTLLTTAVGALVKACEMHQAMAASLLARAKEDAAVQRSMLDAVRTHYLGRVEAEAEAMEAQQKKNPLDEMIEQLLPMLVPAVAAHMAGGAPAGAKK